MTQRIDKRDRAIQFRQRLTQALAQSGLSRAALARAVGVDRSTITQLLSPNDARLPNAQVIAECAASLNVSADWLLGLSDRREQAGELLASSFTMTEAGRPLVDEQIFTWHREAEGYKIRHVPAALPDLLKTDAMLRWEYAERDERPPDLAIEAIKARLNWMQATASDYEIAFPLHQLEAFARAEGYYRGLPAATRLAQIDRILELHEQHYPSLRLFLYATPRIYSAPLTVFGPLLAVIFMGRHYIAFRDTERVRAFAQHFDWLVREARIDAPAVPDFLRLLRSKISDL